MSTPPGVLLVDLGGVAARFTPERRLRALAAATGLSEKAIHARIWDSGLERDAERGRYASDEIVEVVRTALDERIGADALVEAWALAFEPDEAVLERLAKTSLPLVLFTNNGPMLDLCVAGPLASFRSRFDRVICSWHLWATKPDPAAFEGARRLVGREPAALFLLDDSEPNVVAAQAAGWQATLVTSRADLEAALARLEA